MKLSKLFALLTLISLFAISSCKDDDDDASGCQTCTLDAIFVTIVTDICQDGDDVIVTIEGSDPQTIAGTTVAEYAASQEAAGATCN